MTERLITILGLIDKTIKQDGILGKLDAVLHAHTLNITEKKILINELCKRIKLKSLRENAFISYIKRVK